MLWNPGFADLRLTCSVLLLDWPKLKLLCADCSNAGSQVGISDLWAVGTGGREKMEAASP